MDLRQFLSILLVFALLGGALWVLRRASSGRFSLTPRSLTGVRSAKVLSSVERLILTPNHTLHVIHVRGREVVIATHPQGCDILIDSAEVQSKCA
jgi:flagellar biogenesis protein FliO